MRWTVGFVLAMEETFSRDSGNPLFRLRYDRVYGERFAYMNRLRLVLSEPCEWCRVKPSDMDDTEEKEVFFVLSEGEWQSIVMHFECIQQQALDSYVREFVEGKTQYEVNHDKGTVEIFNRNP